MKYSQSFTHPIFNSKALIAHHETRRILAKSRDQDWNITEQQYLRIAQNNKIVATAKKDPSFRDMRITHCRWLDDARKEAKKAGNKQQPFQELENHFRRLCGSLLTSKASFNFSGKMAFKLSEYKSAKEASASLRMAPPAPAA